MDNLNYNNHTGSPWFKESWLGWLGVIGGLWLVMAPFTLDYSDNQAPLYNDMFVGILAIVLTAFCAITAGNPNTFQARKSAGWLTLVAGFWLIIAPFVLGYSGTSDALWSDVITGILFVIVAGIGVSGLTGRLADPT
jgi:hypothetical protein